MTSARGLATSLAWYDAIFRTHGIVGAASNGLWSTDAVVPPYHSNAITLTPDAADAQTDAISAMRARLGREFTVKDSFATLDLAPLGFRVLFEAQWIECDAPPLAESDASGVAWRRVTTPAALAQWEEAWRANGSPATQRVFLPSLVHRQEVALFGGHRDGRLVAGFAANRSLDAVGFSNFFTSATDPAATSASAIEEVARFAAGRPIVGYESGDALLRAERLGFRRAGPLRVWTAG